MQHVSDARSPVALNRWKRLLLGEHPRALLGLLAPTALAILLDIVLRARLIAEFAPQGKAIYFSSLAVSAAFWVLPLWLAARLWGIAARTEKTRARLLARVALGVFFVGWVWPLATCSYGGQLVYFKVVHGYVGRDTVRLGFALRGTVRDWFVSWGSSLALISMLALGLVATLVIAYVVRRAAPHVSGRPPLLPLVTFFAALFVFWIDMVDSRFLQASTPDDCFVHGVVHAVRVGVTGQGRTRHGISIRTPLPLPPLTVAAHRPNVLLVLLESVRADALCSDPPPRCQARFLDSVASERISLGNLTTPTPGTFGSCMILWTGQPATASPSDAHSAPLLWEVAHAEGYRTGYLTSQNLLFENLGAFVQIAGIDVKKSAADLGALRQEQLGAPDERATAEMLRFVRETPAGTPWFGVLHLSNTHAPYRVDPELEPFAPHSADPLGNVGALHNHYRNSVLLMERTVTAFLAELKAMPGWDDTVVVVVADHGEQFRERGGLYHLHSLYEEEVRVPGFVLSGKDALTEEQRAGLRTFAGQRTYMPDVNATIVELLGAGAARASFPLVNRSARSLLSPMGVIGGEPIVPMATVTAVWEAETVRYAVMQGDSLLSGAPGAPWQCFKIARDPGEHTALPADRCGPRMREAASVFGP